MSLRHFAADLYANKVVVVTGASGTIGAELARQFGRHGAHVVITGRSEERLAATRHSLDILGVPSLTVTCDVRDEQEVWSVVAQATDRFGSIDVLVNNAGANFYSPAATMSHRSLQTVIDVDVIGTFHFTRSVVDGMIERRCGAVLSILIPFPERGFPFYSHAGAAKAAIQSLTAAWAREWGGYGIRVNALGPGPTPTVGASTNMLVGDPRMDGTFEAVTPRVALGRLCAPIDIASAALFLCSDAASFITGVTLPVDGGISLPALTVPEPVERDP
jgi:NAD(P)-dependent dehydrogenase (short-subunit alcohol dehydrogenase family)